MFVGYRTVICAVIYGALSTFTGVTGWTIQGFQPDPNWLAHDLLLATGVFAKLGLSGMMQSVATMALNSLAPKIVDAVRGSLGVK